MRLRTRVNSPWALYDALIEQVPDSLIAEKTFAGAHWIAVESSEGGTGLAMRINSETFRPSIKDDPSGTPLKELARRVKSWNLVEAGYGLAAINAYYNHADRASSLGIDLSCQSMANEAFQKYREEITGKKAAVVGHFPYLERLLGPVCELSILERRPSEGDYPDPACEYILPEQDYVFISGSSLVNKTLPRLLSLCAGRGAILVGPSVPLSPVLFDFGASGLSCFVVLDSALCFKAVSEDGNMQHFEAGTMVNYRAY